MAMPKHYKRWLRAAKAAGWRVREARSGAVILYPPDGSRPIPLHVSPGEGRAQQNQRAQLRRHGLDV